MALLEIQDMPQIEGVDIPKQFYCVSVDPAPLAGMRYPSGLSHQIWQNIAAVGYQHVVCLTGDAFLYDPTPLSVLHATGLEDLFHGSPPSNPERELGLIHRAVRVVVDRLKSGEGVIMHCVGGRGRSGTVIGSVLCEIGYSALEVIPYLDRLHKARGKPGWPESHWQAEVVENWT